MTSTRGGRLMPACRSHSRPAIPACLPLATCGPARPSASRPPSARARRRCARFTSTSRSLTPPREGAVRSIVVLGAGMSGGVAAKTLRGEGYDGRLVLIGHEPTPPFGRPPLSKSYLRGEESLSGWYVAPVAWYDDNRVER